MSLPLERAEYWSVDPNPLLCHFPTLHITITWYGVLFALGLITTYHLFGRLWRERGANRAAEIVQPGISTYWQERLFTWNYLFILLGARAGEVVFYHWDFYQHHLGEIPKIWKGGLSSHGALIGVFIATLSFLRLNGANSSFRLLHIQILELFDLIALSACPAMALIRVGNFINQEILGNPTSVPWAILFLSPKDGSSAVPRHPVQLYEAAAYLTIGAALWSLRKLPAMKNRGKMLGAFLTSIFSVRIAVEFFKAPLDGSQSHDHLLTTGQILSLPFLALGLFLLSRSQNDL